ncbi:MAG TPA: HAD family hydrolase [Ktedonobacteraceae bacterium]|jgi:HAD superfamily hydrolase (TIGR01509 family)|nr:HAD family hydrolase [Ktedonobacteraceae bacterium]
MDAVIFDMDGVIVDSEVHWKTSEGFFLQSLVPAWNIDDQDKIIGLALHDVYKMLVDTYQLQKTKAEFLELYLEMANEIYGQKVSLIAGFPELLTRLYEHNIPVALASSSPRTWIDIVLQRFHLRECFKVVVSADELNGEGKPSPAIYLLTAKRLGIRPERCVAIEDSKNGVLSAKNAGMFCIGFRNGFNDEQDLSRADRVIYGFDEVDWPVLRQR